MKIISTFDQDVILNPVRITSCSEFSCPPVLPTFADFVESYRENKVYKKCDLAFSTEKKVKLIIL